MLYLPQLVGILHAGIVIVYRIGQGRKGIKTACFTITWQIRRKIFFPELLGEI
jgi:hypothetical protein